MPASKLDIAKKQHRERSQPANRKKLGLLEKHKDYVQRAKDYHSKQSRLALLRNRAATRNKDEFYFGMQSARVQKGVHTKIKNGSIDSDAVKLLKSQDVKYIQGKRKQEQKKIDSLRESLQMTGQIVDDQPIASTSKHTMFVDAVEDLRKAKADFSAVNPKTKRIGADHGSIDAIKAELQQRIKREQSLAQVQRDLEVQNLLQSKGGRREIIKPVKQDPQEVHYDDDENSVKELRKGLHKPEVGVRTGARVWKWKAERRR